MKSFFISFSHCCPIEILAMIICIIIFFPWGVNGSEIKEQLIATVKVKNDIAPKPEDSHKPFEVRKQYIDKGYKLVRHNDFKQTRTVVLSPRQEPSLKAKGYDLEEFKKRQIPHEWNLDFDILPGSVTFQKANNGFYLNTGAGKVRLIAKYFDSMKSSFFFEITLKNESKENSCEVEIGAWGSRPIKSGHNSIIKDTLLPEQEKTFQWEVSVFERFPEFLPYLTLKGSVSLKEYNAFRLDHKEFTVVEGRIKARSKLPDPRNTDYPDCRYTAQFVGNSIVSGAPCNREIVLSIDGFVGKKVLFSNGLKENDKIKCGIIPFDSVPENLSSTEVADSLFLYNLDSYLLVSYKSIKAFTDYTEVNLGARFKDDDVNKKYISIFKRHFNPELSKEEKDSQKRVIAKDLRKIEGLLKPYSGEKIKDINTEFRKAWEKEKRKDPPGINRARRIVWRNMGKAFYALPESHTIIGNYPVISQSNIEALVALRDYLETQGIQLIVSLVPDYFDISARVINPEFADLPDFRTANIVKQLLEKGIETIYASDIIVRNYNKYEIPFFYPFDSHPGDLPQDILSSLLTERIGRFKFPRQYEEKDFQIVRGNFVPWMKLSNQTFPKNCDIGSHKPGDYYPFNRILYKSKEINKDKNSKVLVLGNSASVCPNHVSDYLCMKSGMGIDHRSVAGYGVLLTAIQRIFNNPMLLLKGRKVLILYVATVNLASDITIPNIRELDSGEEIIHNCKLIKEIKINGTEAVIPNFAIQLSDPSVFRTDRNGSYSIIRETDKLTSGLDLTKDGFLIVDYCCDSISPLQFVVNESSYPLSGVGVDHTAIWFRKVIPIPYNGKPFSLKVVGKPNTLFVIGKIQIYQ